MFLEHDPPNRSPITEISMMAEWTGDEAIFELFVKALKEQWKRTGQTQEAKDFVVVKIGNAESFKAGSIVVDERVPGEVSRRNDVLERATR